MKYKIPSMFLIIIIILLSGCSENYFKLAAKYNDSSYCEKINNDLMADYCYEEVASKSKDPSLCDKINSNIKNSCYSVVASKLKDINLCEKISNLNTKNGCYTRVYMSIAVATNDSTFCDKIIYNSKLPGGSTIKDECYNEIARKTNNYDLCKKMENDYFRNFCYRDIAISTNNQTICEEINKEDNRRYCYARSMMSAQECENISEPRLKDNCYYVIAVNTSNDSLCEEITALKFLREKCISVVES